VIVRDGTGRGTARIWNFDQFSTDSEVWKVCTADIWTFKFPHHKRMAAFSMLHRSVPCNLKGRNGLEDDLAGITSDGCFVRTV